MVRHAPTLESRTTTANPANPLLQSLDSIAYILGALTAGGGITGYVRTRSVPSIVAGVTVGTLVRLPPLRSQTPRS